MEKNRILYIDRLRGVNILLVVMGHVITRNVIEGEESGIYVWGSTFRMPLFMFLCGYIANKIVKPKIFKNYGRFVLKKCRTLLLPFFVWPLLVGNLFFTDHSNLDFWNKFIQLINGGGLWFLWQLFFITLLYSFWLFFSHRWNKNNKILLDLVFSIILLTALGGIWKFDLVSFIKPLIFFFVFYFMGVFVAKYTFLTKILLDQRIFSIALISFPVLVGRYYYGLTSIENTVIKWFCAAMGIAIFYYIIRKVSWPQFIDKYIRYWGVNSLVIYVTHFYVVAIFSIPFISSEMNQIPLLFISCILAILVVLVSMAIFKLLKMSSILDFLLYGNSLVKKKYFKT